MAYQTGTATSANDLLDKLRLFAIAQGWTANRWATAGSGQELCLSKGAAYFNFRSYQNETILVNGTSTTLRYGISMNGSDGYAGGNAWDRQPGYPIRPGGTAGSEQGHGYMPFVVSQGPFVAYHLFAPDNKTIYLEFEITTGTFLRLGFGTLDLFNSSTPGGGRFFYSTGGNGSVTNSVTNATWLGMDIDDNGYALEEVPFRHADYSTTVACSGSFVRAAFDSFNNWCGSGRSASYTNMMQACQGGGVHDRLIRDLSPNPMNGIGVLTPNIVSVNRANEYLHPIGVIPGLRYMDMTNYLPGDEFTIGTDTWKVFPWYNKGGRSYQRAIAYKKVA